MNLKMEKAKLERELKKSGIDYVFKRKKKDERGEDIIDVEPEKVDEINCLLHVSSETYVFKDSDGNNTYKSKPTTQLLTLYEKVAQIEPEDLVEVGGKLYEVVEIININDWGIFADISLELIPVQKEADGNG